MDYPVRDSEAEIQFELMYRLKRRGLDVRCQVPSDNCLLDLVVFDKDKIAVCIIECKAVESKILKRKPKIQHRKFQRCAQIKKYRKIFPIPVLVCAGWEGIGRTWQRVLALLHISFQHIN